jgi:iron-only hydrogenase group A
MAKSFEIKLNNKKIIAFDGETILELARRNNFYIPTLCYHSDLEPNGSCRLCLVEVSCGGREFIVTTACNTRVIEGMEIKLDTAKVKRIRKLNLEMLFSDHIQKCDDCNWRYDCELKKLAKEFGIKEPRFSERKRKFKTDSQTPSMHWDSSKCIECGNCISTCQQITGLDVLKTEYRGSSIIFGPKGGRSFADTNCVFCGQCILHCPAGSRQEKTELPEVEKLLQKKNKKNILVAQIAPSTRYSIGELFGLEPGVNLEKKVVTALKHIGFDYVFDVNFGADITTLEEAAELIERLESKKNLPMFTSCCPAWVRYVEIFHHELIPNLATTKSPTHCLACAIKNYFAKKMRVNPKRIIIVAIMPCVAKKYEAKLPELREIYNPEINYSLTVREIGRLIKKHNLDIENLADSDFDSPLGNSSGAGTIYGASGGVMESALRTVSSQLSDSKMEKIDFSEVRGLDGIKSAVVKIDGINLEVAVVSGLKNATKLIKDLKSGVVRYNYIEVMACPGGCLGGGGQPIPTDNEIREKRRSGFYIDDKEKPIRKAHENHDVKKLYSNLDSKPLEGRASRLFHRKFTKRRKK